MADKPKLKSQHIPGHILQLTLANGVTPLDKEILAVINRMVRYAPSDQFIANELGHSKETIKKARQLMEKKGLCISNKEKKKKKRFKVDLPDPPKKTMEEGLVIDSVIMNIFGNSLLRQVVAVDCGFPKHADGWKAWKIGISKRHFLRQKDILKFMGVLKSIKKIMGGLGEVLSYQEREVLSSFQGKFCPSFGKEVFSKDILGNSSSLSKDKEDKKLDKPTSINGEFSKNEFSNETSCSSKDNKMFLKKQTPLATINNETSLENLIIPNSETKKDKLMEDAAFETKPRLYELLDKVSTKPKPKKKKAHRKCQELEEMLICFPKLPKVKITENSYLKCAKVIKDLENGLYETYGMEMVNLIAANLEETGITKSQVLKVFRNKYSKEERFEFYLRLEKLKDPTYLPNLKQNGLNIGNALYNPHAMGIKSWLVYVMIKPPVKKLEWTDDELQQRNNALKQLKEAWENMNDNRIDNALKWLHIHYKKDLVDKGDKDGNLGELCSGGFDKFISRYIAWMMVYYGEMVDKDDAIVNVGWLDKKSKPFRKFMETYKDYMDHLMECVN